MLSRKRKEHCIIFTAWQTCGRYKTSVFIFSPLKTILLMLADFLVGNGSFPTHRWEVYRRKYRSLKSMEFTTKYKTTEMPDPYACRMPPGS